MYQRVKRQHLSSKTDKSRDLGTKRYKIITLFCQYFTKHRHLSRPPTSTLLVPSNEVESNMKDTAIIEVTNLLKQNKKRKRKREVLTHCRRNYDCIYLKQQAFNPLGSPNWTSCVS